MSGATNNLAIGHQAGQTDGCARADELLVAIVESTQTIASCEDRLHESWDSNFGESEMRLIDTINEARSARKAAFENAFAYLREKGLIP